MGLATRDAVIVVPGIMGSELVDTNTDETIWGSSKPRWYVDAWTTGAPLDKLNLDVRESDGEYGRVRATRLLRSPSFAPILRGFEPYTKLLNEIKKTLVHPDALWEFPYDWRLPIEYSTRLLRDACMRQLHGWAKHPAQLAAAESDPDRSDPKLVIIAHSMGGLLAIGLASIDFDLDLVRRIITLGTPFYGAVSAALLVSTGIGGPRILPQAQMSRLSRTLPSVYDLMPTYRCVDMGGSADRLTPHTISQFGGSESLAEAAARHDTHGTRSALTHKLVQLTGVRQQTPQSMVISHGLVEGAEYTCEPTLDGGIVRLDLGGDGVVPRRSSELAGSTPAMPLAQSHGALAKATEATIVITDLLLNHQTGPWQGRDNLGLNVPDVVVAGKRFEVEALGVRGPRDVACRVSRTDSTRPFLRPVFRPSDGKIQASILLPESGLYRVEVDGGGGSPVSQILLAID